MKIPWRVRPLDRAASVKLAGAVGALAIASIVYSQFSINGWLKRDSAIYMYGGQQMLHGRPPYVSIMDPKGPLAGIISGFGTALAHLFGSQDVLVIRAEFCAISILTVLAVYLLTVRIWDSVIGGLIAAVAFTSFEGFAKDALVGPNGHTPGIFFMVAALWLTVRRNWYLAGFAAAAAFLTWQPLFPFPIAALGCALVWTGAQRRAAALRVLAGGLTPLVALAVYYAALGELGKLFVGLVEFPLTGVQNPPRTLAHRITYIFRDVRHQYGLSSMLLWLGLLLLVAIGVVEAVRARRARTSLATNPVVLLLGTTLVVELGYLLYDYQGYSHAFPLLPYAAAGLGGAAAYAVQAAPAPSVRRAVAGALGAGVLLGTVVAAVSYYQPSRNNALRGEEASACAINRVLVPGTPLWTMGNPLPLVLLHRRNPDNYPYLGAGLDHWRIKHTRGGFRAWTKQVRDSRASVIVLDVWRGKVAKRMAKWLTTHGYHPGYIGPWRVYVTPEAYARMSGQGVGLAIRAQLYPVSPTGTRLTATGCVA